ncbi:MULTISPECIES: acetyltransferase [Idiomarina]|jgi:sugar O-acyltransferase (sialic acid O-acetyltransferase NeuD family)|uniref:acetyltransferase n=1 Tax=Idiomarina TaxID=135575 RepID=UPI000C092CAA|nr:MULTISPECIES: acetyltransferase [Idiomarina]MAC34670.1 acetyltransferase [Haliea sp.]MAO68548.1 acetyltransferase [Idiomarina sp.]MBF81303.1 acetyltransferase [Idiomarina sp.]|tara:strand:+ start:19649 stop:20269 length:621 start_codon:yes stop_codon:yes gene_type:complete
MTVRLGVIGASGHGKVVADIARTCGVSEIVFYDDRWQEFAQHYGCPVVGTVDDAFAQAAVQYDEAIVAIGNAKVRSTIQNQLQRVASALIHPSAVVSPSAQLGQGTVVMPNAVVNSDTVIGDGVIINTGAVVEHDCKIGDYSHICPNTALAGGVTVGAQSWIGIGSSVIQLITIGSDVTVGAGSVIIRDIPNGHTVVGNPAKLLNR